MCLFLEISPYIGTTGCSHKKGYAGPVQHVYINLFTISRYINKLFLGKRYMSHMPFTKSINKRFTVNKPTTSAQIHCVFGSSVINHRMSNNEKFNAQCTTGNQYW